MKHQNGKQREKGGERIEIHQKHVDIHKIKAEKRGIAAELINSVRHYLGFILIGNARASNVAILISVSTVWSVFSLRLPIWRVCIPFFLCSSVLPK